MGRYAENTSVSVGRSKEEIERTITRYGATAFMSAFDSVAGLAVVGFNCRGRQVKFLMTLPAVSEFSLSPAGRTRKADAQAKAHEQACRSAWRSLALVIKAKFEAIETGVTTFDAEFLAHLVAPGGQTVGDVILPALDAGALGKELPKLLPA